MKNSTPKTFLLAATLLLMGVSNSFSQTKAFIADTNFRGFLNTYYSTFMDASGDSLITDSAATLTGNLNCSNRSIVNLSGLEHFVNITSISCFNNQLTSFPDISSLTVLEWLLCSNNQLTSLPDFSSNIAFYWLDCGENQLTSLPDFSNNPALGLLYCDDNQLTTLPDLSSNTSLTQLYCQDNQLTSLPNLSSNTALAWLHCYNNQLTSLPSLSNNSNLIELYCYNNQLSSLPDLSNNTKLTRIHCQDNQLTALPSLSTITTLEYLYCQNNQLTSLPNLSSNTDLFWVYCNDNLLSSLPDLSNNTTLQLFDCRDNKLDFSDTKELRIADDLSSLLGFWYSPQNPFGTSDTFDLYVGDPLTLSIPKQDSALSYQWFKGGSSISGATDTAFTIANVALADSGSYTCRSYGTALSSPAMQASPGIGEFESEPFIVNVDLTTHATNKLLNTNPVLYPNPSKDNASIDLGEQFSSIVLTVWNATGQTMERYRFEGKRIISLNIENYAAGIYYLRIEADKKEAILQLIK